MSQNFGVQMGGRTKMILLVMGVIFIVMGVAFVVFLGSIPFAGGSMVGTGGIFIAVGVAEVIAAFVIGGRTAASQRIAAQGVPGTARVVGLTQTGMSLNDQPQIGMDLEVSIPGQPVYRTQHREFVPLLLLSRLQPGGYLAVRVDPANPQKVIVMWNEAPGMAQAGFTAQQGAGPYAGQGGGPVGATLAQAAAAMQASGAPAAPVFGSADQANYSVEQLRQWLRENGLPGTARIDMLQDAGQTVGTDRMMVMQVTLDVPGKPSFQGPPSAAMVPVDKVGRLAVGITLPVLVAPENPNMTMFEWDKI